MPAWSGRVQGRGDPLDGRWVNVPRTPRVGDTVSVDDGRTYTVPDVPGGHVLIPTGRRRGGAAEHRGQLAPAAPTG